MDFSHRPGKIEVMQNRNPEDNVKTCITKFEFVGVHFEEIAGIS